MVVTCGIVDLVESSIGDGLLNSVGLTEVHRGTGHVTDLTRWDVFSVRRGELVGVDIHDLVCADLRRITVEVEIGVVGHVDDSLLISSSLKGDVERVVTLHKVGGSCFYCARESILTVGGSNGEGHTAVGLCLHIIYLMEPSGVATTMECVLIVVGTKLIDFAAYSDLCILDAVGIAANTGTIVGGTVQSVGILTDIVIAKHYVGGLSLFIWHTEGDNTTSVVGQAYLHAIIVLQGDEFNLLSIQCGVKGSRIKTGYGAAGGVVTGT